MRRGALRHRLQVYVPEVYLFGNEVSAWKLLGKPCGSVRVLESVESAGNDLQGVELVEFTIPYSKRLEDNQHDVIIVHRGHEYDVLGIKNIEYKDRELRLQAKRYEGVKRVTNVEV
ncbi:TPA: hypothetical protein I7172_13875 [Vibrio vulnificus]|nr:hypothetical protein [Vibrio vulnificus]